VDYSRVSRLSPIISNCLEVESAVAGLVATVIVAYVLIEPSLPLGG